MAHFPCLFSSCRICKFSPDGCFLAASESEDFIHIFDVCGASNSLEPIQTISMMGEPAGIAFNQNSDVFYVGSECGVMEFQKNSKSLCAGEVFL